MPQTPTLPEKPQIATQNFSSKEASPILDKAKTRAIIVILSTSLLWCAILAVWLSYDHHFPANDEANHIMNGLTYRDLLKHARPFNLKWLQQFFMVNRYYPPVGTLSIGLGSYLFHNINLALAAVKIFWLLIASLSTGFIALRTTNRLSAAIFAISFLNCCTSTIIFSHISLLDMPLIAMSALALAALYWKNGRSAIYPSLISGIAIGLACMTKQVAIAFLGFPIVLDFIRTIRQSGTKASLISLTALTLPTITICTPWLLLNYSWMQSLNSEIAADLAKRGNWLTRTTFNGLYYAGSFYYCTGPLVSILALLGFSKITSKELKQLNILLFSVLPAMIALTFLQCQPARDRYISVLVVLVSVVAGNFVSKSITNASKTKTLPLILTLAVVSTALYASFTFTPFPLTQFPFLANVAQLLEMKSREHESPFFTQESVTFAGHSSPTPASQDLPGQILDAIPQPKSNAIEWLNVTALAGGLDVHGLDLLAKCRGLNIRPTTTRKWTALGDTEEFSKESADNFTWYLIKTGNQGFRFADSNSQNAHLQLIDYVKNSGKFRMVRQLAGTDGSTVFLYKLRS